MNHRMKMHVAGGAGGLVLALGAAHAWEAPALVADSVCSSPAASADIVDTAVAAGSFQTLVAAVQAAGLVEALKQPGPLTVFAPTDEAFASLPKGTLESLLKPENKDQLQAILLYHVVEGSVPSSEVVKLRGAATLNGQRVDILAERGGVKVDSARVVSADVTCTNGVIHVIDSVLLPSSNDIVETAMEAKTFQTLIAAAKAAGLVETLRGKGPLTVFAPTDEAFAALGADTIQSLLKPENKAALAGILKNHVVPGRVYLDQASKAGQAATIEGTMLSITGGESPMVEQARIVSRDIDASNGVIHVINAVLVPKAD
jgi:uncharacterized surface protein with fasciclin (FAS1) repeats